MRRKVDYILQTLDELFPNPEVPLKHTSHYELLIAVLLSAQCTDKKVNEVTPHLFSRANTPEQMVLLGTEKIAVIIKPIGLSNTKSKAIFQLSKLLIENFDGEVPDTLEELEKLPGVGHKTASVILCQAFKKPALPVDTHIHRLAKRWGLSDGSSVKKTEEDLKKIFPKNRWIKLHLQIIYYARRYCPAKKHLHCPICTHLQTH